MNVSNDKSRPLSGWTIGISISESEDSSSKGFNKLEVNRCVVRLAECLLGYGARLVFGHDWRPGGVMESIATLAQRYRPIDLRESGPPLILNYVPWPDLPALDKMQDLKKKLSGILKAEQVPLPEPLMPVSKKPAAQKVLKAIALSQLRAKLNEVCDARVCLGGKESEYQGWLPGIVEETVLAARAEKPVYLGGMLGGASRRIAEALDGQAVPFRADPRTDLQKEFVKYVGDTGKFGRFMPEPVSISRLPENGLNAKDEKRLHQDPEIDDVIVLVLRGLLGLANRRVED